MSVDPNMDYSSHDPDDREEPSKDPEIREAQELEKQVRDALATKDNPLSDTERTSDRLRGTSSGGAAGAEQPTEDEQRGGRSGDEA